MKIVRTPRQHRAQLAKGAYLANEVLCRVFNEPDQAMEEWHAWYKPEEWISPERALGGFLWKKLQTTPVSPTPLTTTEAER